MSLFGGPVFMRAGAELRTRCRSDAAAGRWTNIRALRLATALCRVCSQEHRSDSQLCSIGSAYLGSRFVLLDTDMAADRQCEQQAHI